MPDFHSPKGKFDPVQSKEHGYCERFIHLCHFTVRTCLIEFRKVYTKKYSAAKNEGEREREKDAQPGS